MSNNADSVVFYLRLTDFNRHFAFAILKILVEDRRTAHAERVNNNRNIVTMHPSDIVIACTAIQSDKATNKVAKLCYTVCEPFQIIRGTGRGSYIVRTFNKPDSLEFKFMSEDLYILPPTLKPCEPVGASGTRYLNQSYAPIVNPLKNPLNIELYNEKWFGAPPKTISPPFKHDHATLSFPSTVLTPFCNLSDLHDKTNTSPPAPLIECVYTDDCSPPTPAALSHSAPQLGWSILYLVYT